MELDKKECVSMQLTLCGEVLRLVKEKQNEHYNLTGQKLSKRLAVFKLILGK